MLSFSIFSHVQAAPADGFPAGEVIEAIKSEINAARLDRAKNLAPLEIVSVDITLTSVTKRKGSLGLQIEVPIVERVGSMLANVGGSLSNTQKLFLTFKPEGDAVQVGGSRNLGLLPAIQSAKIAIQSAATGDLKLALQTFDYEVQFAVTKNADGDISFVFINAKSAHENLAIQLIKIHMRPGRYASGWFFLSGLCPQNQGRDFVI